MSRSLRVALHASTLVINYKRIMRSCIAVFLFLGAFISVQGQCTSCGECETPSGTGVAIDAPYGFPFDNGDGVSFGDDGAVGLLAGADNSFGGAGYLVDASVANYALADLCLSADFVLTAANPADYPLTIELRIENGNCGGFPCPWIDFYTTVNADGSYAIGGNLASGSPNGNGASFDPAGLDPTIIVSIANFSGTPLAGDVTLNFSNLSLVNSGCTPIMGCVPSGGGSGCISCGECEAPSETAIPAPFTFPFDNGDGVSFGGEGAIGLLAGANNSFGGAGHLVDASVAGFTLADLCLTGDFVITSTNPADYPMTIEFRIENGNCGGFPCPWVDFYTPVTADGTYMLGGNLASANVGAAGPFNPAGTDQTIIISVANFSGTPLAGDVTITYSNISLVSAECLAVPGCGSGTADCLGVVGGPATPGTACNDNNPNTINDTYQADCSCSGTAAPDCAGTPGGSATPGTACNDNNAGTFNDVYDANCNCAGTPYDCPNILANNGDACDDGNPNTTGDVVTNCACSGTAVPVDCAGTPNGTATPGTACDDGNPNTGNDTYDANCNCVGQAVDCLGTPGGTATPGTACDDGNSNTAADAYDAGCNCVGVAIDCEGTPGGTAVIDACGNCLEPTDPSFGQGCSDCAGVVNGTSVVDACGVCLEPSDANFNQSCADCAGTPNGSAQADCSGTCNGTAFVDGCGTCVGGNTGMTACSTDCAGVAGGSAVLDCNGVCNGTATTDACGNCVGGNTGATACANDCAGVPGGSAVADCNGDCNGTAFVDGCGTCVGGNTGMTACATDCAGVAGGSAVADCNGDCNGTATTDACGNCVGGNTGATACVNDCAGVPGGSAMMDCAGVCNGTATVDGCGNCVGGTTGATPCPSDCAGVPGGNAVADCNGDCNGTATTDACGNCVGGNTGATACVIDCAGVPGGSAVTDCNGDCNGTATTDACGNCVGGNTGATACMATCNNIPGFDVCNCDATANLVLDSAPCTLGTNQTQLYLLVDVVDGTITSDPDNNQVIAVNTSINFSAPTGDYVIYELVIDAALIGQVNLMGADANALIALFEGLGAVQTSPGIWMDPNGNSVAVSGLITVNGPACGCNMPPVGCPNGGACIGSSAFCADGGVPNITMALYDTNGTLLGTDLTDSNGAYSFCNLPAGNYQVVSGTVPGESNIGAAFLSVSLGACEINNNINFEYTGCGTAGGGGGGGGGANCSDIVVTTTIDCIDIPNQIYTVIVEIQPGIYTTSGYTITRPDGSTVQLGGINGYTDTNSYSIANSPTYTYVVTSIADPSCSTSTGPVVAVCGGVAIELLSFEGNEAGKANYLQWITASESDNASFTLMRSENGQDFEAISTIDSQGNSSTAQHYDYSDFEYRTPTSYYRLMETDNSGNSQFAGDIVVIERQDFTFEISNVYPVPTSSVVNVDFVNTRRELVGVQVFDLTGKLIERLEFGTVKGVNTIQLSIDDYAVGTYLISIASDSNVATAKFVKD